MGASPGQARPGNSTLSYTHPALVLFWLLTTSFETGCIERHEPSFEGPDSHASDDLGMVSVDATQPPVDVGRTPVDARWVADASTPRPDAFSNWDGAIHADAGTTADAGMDLDQDLVPDIPFNQLPLPEMTCEVISPAEGEIVRTRPIEVLIAAQVEGEPAEWCSVDLTLFGADLTDVRQYWSPCDDYGRFGLGRGRAAVRFAPPVEGLTRLEAWVTFTIEPPFRPGAYRRMCERTFVVEHDE